MKFERVDEHMTIFELLTDKLRNTWFEVINPNTQKRYKFVINNEPRICGVGRDNILKESLSCEDLDVLFQTDINPDKLRIDKNKVFYYQETQSDSFAINPARKIIGIEDIKEEPNMKLEYTIQNFIDEFDDFLKPSCHIILSMCDGQASLSTNFQFLKELPKGILSTVITYMDVENSTLVLTLEEAA